MIILRSLIKVATENDSPGILKTIQTKLEVLHMKKISIFTGIGLTLMLVILAGFPQAMVSADGGQLPYKAGGPEFVVQEVPHPDCGPGRLKVDIQGSGQGTYVGQYSIVRQHCFNFATFTIEDGSFEQTAANGDKLWGTYSGYTAGVLEFSEDGSPVVILINSPWTITGGTGRFAGAEGAGIAVGVFNVVSESGNFDMDGWISYSASE